MVSIEVIREAYGRLGSVWKVGEELAIAGQTVHQRLRDIGEGKRMNYFSDADKEKLMKEYLVHRANNTLDALAIEMGRTKQFMCREAGKLGLTNAKTLRWADSKREVLSDAAKSRIKKYGHPKGMQGKFHSDEFKQGASKRFIAMWADPNCKLNSDEHRQIKSDNMAKWQSTREASDNYSRTKYGWFEKCGHLIFMRSSWELNYAHYLNFLILHKQIKDWEYETDTFWFENIKRGVRSYKPDFKVYLLSDEIEYHEVKGWMDSKSETKLKRMQLYYPKIKIVLVGANEYKAIKKKAPLIAGWGTWITENPNKPSNLPT